MIRVFLMFELYKSFITPMRIEMHARTFRVWVD